MIADVAAVQVLRPADVWSVSYDQGACVLMRPFAEDGSVTLALRQVPLSDTVALVPLGDAILPRREEGEALVALEPDRGSFTQAYRTGYLPSNRKAVMLDAPAEMLALLPRTGAIRIAFNGKPAAELASTANGAGLSALNDCTRQVVRRWGVDTAKLAAVAQPPELGAGKRAIGLFTPAMYPREAIRQNVQGAATVLVAVRSDGSVSSCRVVESSGNALLNQASCTPFLQARFRPALDGNGQPVASYLAQRVHWRLPVRSTMRLSPPNPMTLTNPR